MGKKLGFEGVRKQIQDFHREKKKVKKFWVLGIIVTLILSFGLYKGLGRLKNSLIQHIPLAVEKKLGDLIIKSLQEQGTLLKSSKKNQMVSELLTFFDPNLIKEFDTITIHYSPKSEINAYALPGGHIVLNKGLILKADNIEEVLGVLPSKRLC